MSARARADASPGAECIAPLFYLVLNNAVRHVEALLDDAEAKASLQPMARVEAICDLKITPLMGACILGYEEIAELLMSRIVESGELVLQPEQNADGHLPNLTPLMCACLWGRPQCVRVLLAHNDSSDVAITQGSGTFHGDSALHLALRVASGPLLPKAHIEDRGTESVRAAAAECAKMILAKRRADEPTRFSADHAGYLLCAHRRSRARAPTRRDAPCEPIVHRPPATRV